MVGNEREQRLRKEKRKKILLVIVLVIIGIIAIFGIVMFILSGVNSILEEQRRQKLDEDDRPPSYIFAPPNYNENIFDDAEYMGRNREMKYTVAELTISITDDNYSQQTAIVKFMYDILQYIIHGDYEKYNSIFIDSYIENAGDALRETFTMQKLYNIDVELANTWETEVSDGKFVVYTDYLVLYMIKNNNGTFRNDFQDEERRPLIYRIMTEVDVRNDVYTSSVYDILSVAKYTSGLYE